MAVGPRAGAQYVGLVGGRGTAAAAGATGPREKGPVGVDERLRATAK